MKRSIILFLVTFLITAGIGGGLYYAISQGLVPGVTIKPRTDTTAIPLELPPAGTETQQQPAPAEPATPAPTQPTVTEQPAPTPEPTPEPTTPAEPEQPSLTDLVDPAEPTETNQPETTTTEPSATAEKPAADAQENTTTEPATPAQPEISATEQQEERIILKPAVTPRNEEHKAVLVACEALKHENPTAAMQQLTERGTMSSEAAAALLEWGKNNKPGAIEEVGNSRREDGARITRFRVKSAEGTQDILIDVITDRNGNVTIGTAIPTSSDKTDITAASDHLSVAEGFVEAVKRGDMIKARSLVTGEQVSDATVAGLCMVFEEGAFSLREEAPIRNTFRNDSFAGYLVYVVAPGDPKPANIGLELARTEPGWRVQAVALDALLSSYENSANAEGGRYFPIVKNPKGGDSLALFFGFNESDLTPRSIRQLQIVAELLKQSKGKLNISGHTDDVGSEKYNQRLSELRADAVKAALVGFGVAADQITTHGLGKSQPRRLYKADDSEQVVDYIRGENRRAEIYLDFES